PCNAAMLAANLLLSKHDDEETKHLGERLLRSLGRADAILNDLLQFARAGGRPDPGARASPGDIIASLEPEFNAEAAAHGVEVRWLSIPPVLVACGDGVYVSLLTNLLRNAIKYGGASPTPSITVAVIEEGVMVRTEVRD